MRNSTVNNSYPIYASRFESCLTQLHLGGTLGLHTHVIILFLIRMLEGKVRGDVGGWECLKSRMLHKGFNVSILFSLTQLLMPKNLAQTSCKTLPIVVRVLDVVIWGLVFSWILLQIRVSLCSNRVRILHRKFRRNCCLIENNIQYRISRTNLYKYHKWITSKFAILI